jgi:uncharacterized protein (TIGR00106 family)
MAFMEISVVPVGTASTGVSRYVAEVIKTVEGLGLQYTLHDMGTTVTGEASQLWAAARLLHESPFANGAKRVYTVVKMDDRRDRDVKPGEKTESVKALL